MANYKLNYIQITKKEQLPTMFTHGQQQLTDHREIANQFKIFFATQFHLSINM